MTRLRLIGPTLPETLTVACSGGPDSMAVWHFLSQKDFRLGKVQMAFFHHGTSASDEALKFLTRWTRHHGVNLVYGRTYANRPQGMSPEQYWREERYKFLTGLSGTVVTGHHLDDQLETWIYGALNGRTKLIPYRHDNVVRPFFLNRKKDLVEYCHTHGLEYVDDPSNYDVKYPRNRIRHKIMSEALLVNPGLHKVISKKILAGEVFEDYNEANVPVDDT